MKTAIENLKDFFTGYVAMCDNVKTQYVLDKIDEYILSERLTVAELNERNSIDEGEKSLPHTCACGNEKKSWYETCDKCWYKEKSE